MNKNPTNKIGILTYVFIVVVIALALFFEGRGITVVTDLFTKIIIGLVYSLVASALVGMFTGDLLENYNRKFFGIEFNIPTMILVFIVKIWLF